MQAIPHNRNTTSREMGMVILALLPGLVALSWIFGPGVWLHIAIMVRTNFRDDVRPLTVFKLHSVSFRILQPVGTGEILISRWDVHVLPLGTTSR